MKSYPAAARRPGDRQPGWLRLFRPQGPQKTGVSAHSVSCRRADDRDDRDGPRDCLVATIGAPPLFAKDSKPAVGAAITLAAITGVADTENRVASTARSLPKTSLALIRHPGRQVGLDKDDSSWQGKDHQVHI